MTSDRDQRVAALAARREERGGPPPGSPPSPRSRRPGRPPASAARVLATGVSTAAMLGLVAILAEAAPRGAEPVLAGPSDPSLPAAPAANVPPSTVPPTTVPAPVPTILVVRRIHRTVYVDEQGRPLGSSGQAGGAAPSSARTAARANPPSRGDRAPAARPAPAPAPQPAPPAPTCRGSKCP